MFYLADETEDLSPGHNLLASSERLLWTGEEEAK